MNLIYINIIIILIITINKLFAQEYQEQLNQQNINQEQAKNKITTRFAKQVVEFQKGEIIANVFIVTNNLSEKQKFYINFTIPNEWKVIAKNHKLYELEPGDSVIVPVHIVPKEKFKGNIRLMFYAFLIDEKGKTIGINYFFGVLERNIKWTLTVPEKKYYIPNNVNYVPFSIGIINESTDDQDIFLSSSSLNKNVQIKDSSNSKDIKFPLTFTLPAFADTQFYFTFNKYKEPRNFRLLDLEDYRPYSTGEAKKYKIHFNSLSPNPAENEKYKSSNSIDFIQLSDKWEVNRYNSLTIPLILDANIFNILGDQPMMSLNLRGDMFLKDSSLLIYQTQITYFSNYFTTIPYENAVFSLAYYHKKFYTTFGYINSGLLGTYQNGKGIKGEYYIKRNHRIGAFYVASPELFKIMPKIYSYGLTHNFENKIIKTATIIGQNINQQNNTTLNAANTNITIKAIKNHTLGFRLGGIYSIKKEDTITTSKTSYMLGIHYSGAPLKNIWNIHLNGNYTSPNFGVFNYERITANIFNKVIIKKNYQFQLQNNFYRYNTMYSNILYTNYQLNNQLNFSKTNKTNLFYNPHLFYYVSRVLNFDVHSRGLGLNVSNYQLENNIRYFFNFRSGYNRAIDSLNKDFFFTQSALFIQVRTLSFMIRYTLGNLNFSKQSFFLQNNKNPQLLGITSRYQHQFKKPSFVYQQLVSYSYNTLTGNQINFTPEFLFFSRTGWRFRIFTEINFSKDNRYRLPDNYSYIHNPEIEIKEPEWNQNIYLGMGIKKEFGIPIPFVKPTHATITFKVFYDVNGNGIRESNETFLENVVIRVNSWELITNEKGTCQLVNVPIGLYPITAFSIVDLQGWFPNINDTININKNKEFGIPFTRGVKITGKVFIQRDPNSPTSDIKLDISRIKIVASNHKTYTALTNKNGYYELYLPAGKYTLSMDESILNNRFQLMQNHFELNIDDKFDNLFIPFYIIEKDRKIRVIRFDNQGNVIED